MEDCVVSRLPEFEVIFQRSDRQPQELVKGLSDMDHCERQFLSMGCRLIQYQLYRINTGVESRASHYYDYDDFGHDDVSHWTGHWKHFCCAH